MSVAELVNVVPVAKDGAGQHISSSVFAKEVHMRQVFDVWGTRYRQQNPR